MTCWEEWQKWVTNKWRTIDWNRCIILESAEAIDSFNWKHWKDINWTNDENNIKIEIVDIWHFIMSYLISKVSDDSKIVNELYSILLYEEEKVLDFGTSFNNNEARIRMFENLIGLSSNRTEEANYEIVKVFFQIMFNNNMTFEELYELYIMKNILNKFRQDNWYKEWTYIKTWNWKEDNEVALEIISNWIESASDFYDKLKKAYSTIS